MKTTANCSSSISASGIELSSVELRGIYFTKYYGGGGGEMATWEYKNIKVQGGGEKEKIASKTG